MLVEKKFGLEEYSEALGELIRQLRRMVNGSRKFEGCPDYLKL